MNIQKSTASFEKWLRAHTDIIESELEFKHRQMASAVFPFYRATFYRFMQHWPEQCPEEAAAPHVLAVGDLHIENFGTWRDAEGRLIWGVNDFDEAWPLPYTIDLVRLAASALLACMTDGSAMGPKAVCNAILSGYRDALKAGGRAFVLSERHPTLSALAHGELRSPGPFWQKMREQHEVDHKTLPAEALAAMEAILPKPLPAYRVIHRVKGLGSLGRQRLIALADWHGGLIARETKALLPSACAWVEETSKPAVHYQQIVSAAVRCGDPFLHFTPAWISRRLAPDCSRIELTSLSRAADEGRLLRAMGWETANIHLGNEGAANAIRKDLRKRPADWLGNPGGQADDQGRDEGLGRLERDLSGGGM